MAHPKPKSNTSNQVGTVRVAEQTDDNLEFARPFPFGGGKDSFGLGFQIEETPATTAFDLAAA